MNQPNEAGSRAAHAPNGTATRTVLFTDLAGYTKQVSNSDRDGLHRLLRSHEALVEPAVTAHGGHIVKNIGDSLMCMFPSATEALRAALKILDAMHEPGATVPSIRLGINTGDVEEIEGDAFGDAVNIAARIIDRTPAGEAWFGVGTRVSMNAAELPWEATGRLLLKGIAGEQKVYRLVPANRVVLPHELREAARDGRLVQVRPDRPVPHVPPDAVVLLQDFTVSEPTLASALRALPVLPPEALFLQAYRMSPWDRQAWSEAGSRLVIGHDSTVSRAIASEVRDAEATSATGMGIGTDAGDTLHIQQFEGFAVDVAVCGLALPRAPFSQVIASYTYSLMPDGSWSPDSDGALLRVEVKADIVWLRALKPDISVANRAVPVGAPVPLDERCAVRTPLGAFEFRPLAGLYCGVLSSIIRGASSIRLAPGSSIELGRKPNPPGIAFRSGIGKHNLSWCPGERAAQARAGGFTLDRVLVGRRQATIELGDDGLRLTPLHRECSTWLLRHDSASEALQEVNDPLTLTVSDLIVAGTSVVGLFLGA